MSVGTCGEKMAMRYLKKNGYKILARNWYNKTGIRLGEIDIIAQKKDGPIVFVEVKTRVVRNVVEKVIPEEQITPAKLRKLQRIAEYYIREHVLWDRSWQFDAVSVLVKDGKLHDLVHLQNIYF